MLHLVEMASPLCSNEMFGKNECTYMLSQSLSSSTLDIETMDLGDPEKLLRVKVQLYHLLVRKGTAFESTAGAIQPSSQKLDQTANMAIKGPIGTFAK